MERKLCEGEKGDNASEESDGGLVVGGGSAGEGSWSDGGGSVGGDWGRGGLLRLAFGGLGDCGGGGGRSHWRGSR